MNVLWLLSLSLAIGGGLATLGWLLFAIFDPTHQNYSSSMWLPFNFLIIGGGLFMTFGLPSLLSLQSHQTGLLGLIAHAVLSVGIMIPYLAVHSVETVTMPNVPRRMMTLVYVGAPALFIGAVLTAIVIWQADILPRWVAVVLLGSIIFVLLAWLVKLPAWLGRNVIPSTFTLVVAVIGLVQMELTAG